MKLKTENKIKTVLISIFGLDFGIRSISSYLKHNGYESYIISFKLRHYPAEFEGNNYITSTLFKHDIYPEKDIKLLISHLKDLNPDIIGLSVSSVVMRTAISVTRAIKENLDTVVVWGGIHAIISPEDCLEYADIVCTGEGEYPMLELAEKLQKRQPVNNIRNMWIKNGTHIEKNPMRPLIQDLDALPFPDFADAGNKLLIDNGRIAEDPPVISGPSVWKYPIMASRGCLYKCSFCCNSVISSRYRDLGPYLRRRSVGSVIAELKNAVRKKSFHSVRFWDDVFTYDKEWIEEFCGRYIQEIGKPFSCYAHPKNTDRDIIGMLKKAGLVWVDMGIQSASEEVSDKIFSRKQSNMEIIEYSKFLKKLDITVCYDLITDNPYETDKDEEVITDLLMELPYPYQIHIYSMCWFPGTPLTERALRDGFIKEEELEQHTSKAIDNFFMSLRLSKGKKNLFWNSVKAMSINNVFSHELIRKIRKSSFWQNHPKVLYFMIFTRMLLGTKIGVENKNGKLRISRKMPVIGNKVFEYIYMSKIDSKFTYKTLNTMFNRRHIRFKVFLSEGTGAGKIVRFQIACDDAAISSIKIKLILTPFYMEENAAHLFDSIIWHAVVPLSSSNDTVLDFFLEAENGVVLRSIDREVMLKLVSGEIPEFFQNGLYSLTVKTEEKHMGNILMPFAKDVKA
ncbi:MAG: radical SAM protein [Elusimicrobiota bacterium]